jgi:hypothetical protein
MKTGKKTAVHKLLRNNSVTYWSQLDKKIEQTETNLPFHVMNIIQKSLKENISNNSLLNKKTTVNQQFKVGRRIKFRNNDDSDMTNSPIKIKR